MPEEKKEMTPNEYILKLSGEACLPQPLKNGQIYNILTEVKITDKNEKDNEDGTCNIIFKAKQTGVASIENERGDVIKTKDSRTMSQKLRGAIWLLRDDKGMTDIDEQVFYETTMKKIITYLPQIYEFLKNKN